MTAAQDQQKSGTSPVQKTLDNQQAVDWKAANGYVLAHNANRSRGQYGKHQKTGQQFGHAKTGQDSTGAAPPLSENNVTDFPLSAAERDAAEGHPMRTYDAAPGEPHAEATKGTGIPWVAANAYTITRNAADQKVKLRSEDKEHFYLGKSQQKDSALPPASAIEDLMIAPSDFPVEMSTSEKVVQLGAAPGEHHKEAAGGKKGAIPWAEANQYVWAANKEANRPNKLPEYVMRSGAVKAA